MALLGYRLPHLQFVEYLCGGTLITERYVLSAAHCLIPNGNRKVVLVRLGEHDISQNKDCQTIFNVKVCSDNPVDVFVESTVIHPNYNPVSYKNDIGLIRLKKPVTFTKYIQPICLPFERNLENADLTDESFLISGWGKTDSGKVTGSPTLQYAFVKIWEQSKCTEVFPPEVQPIADTQICANGLKSEDVCKGDSGGPLLNATIDIDDEIRHFQIGIVSFASTMACGIEELPPIYTRVDRYLKWIADSVQYTI